MYDDIIVSCFLENQLELYPEPVAESEDEARDFLEEICAAVANDKKEAIEYLEEVGVDTEGMSEDEILDLPEIMRTYDGRYLILEI